MPLSSQHAVVIGGSRAVCACPVAELAADPEYAKIKCLNRRKWPLPVLSVGQDKLRHVTRDVAREDELAAAVGSAGDITAAFCALGATRRSRAQPQGASMLYFDLIVLICHRVAGSAEAFRAIDPQYVFSPSPASPPRFHCPHFPAALQFYSCVCKRVQALSSAILSRHITRR